MHVLYLDLVMSDLGLRLMVVLLLLRVYYRHGSGAKCLRSHHRLVLHLHVLWLRGLLDHSIVWHDEYVFALRL